MKKTTSAPIVALAFGLGLAATPALAAEYGPGRDRNDQPAAQSQQQDQNHKGDKGDKGDRARGREHRNNDQHQRGQKPSGMNKTDWQNNNNNNANDRNRNNDNRWNDNNNRRNGSDFNRNHRNDRNWDGNRNRGNININNYRRNMTSPRRFRIGKYHAPRGYHYRRWHYGERLPAFYYARDYWLLDFIAFGLFAPPPGYVWVRYGSDALLIDTETGEIIQVRYDVFYS